MIIEHRDETAARAAYPAFVTTSVTLLSFHAPRDVPGGLTIDRHGSLPIGEVRRVVERFG